MRHLLHLTPEDMGDGKGETVENGCCYKQKEKTIYRFVQLVDKVKK